MAVTTPPPGAPAPTWATADRYSPATPLGQVATALVVALAMVLPLWLVDQMPLAVACCAALVGGIALGIGAGLAPKFSSLPGVIAAFLVTLAAVVLTGIGSGTIGLPFPPWQLFPLLFIFVVGLDWTRVERLRGHVVLAGLLVVSMVGLERDWALSAALAWLVMAIGALWALEQDRRAALVAPTPLYAPTGPAPGAQPADLARTLGLAIAIGLTAAFLLGSPSCSFRPPWSPNLNSPTPDPGLAGRDFEEFDLETPTQERAYDLGPDGERRFVDPETGERITVERQPDGSRVGRDSQGREVVELDDEGVVAKDGDDEQRYQVDDDGQFTVTSPEGDTYRLGEEDGEPVLRDADDQIVARGDGDGHLVVRDPDGRVLVDDPDGDGLIPVPDAATRHGIGADGDPVGRTYEQDGDRTIVTDPDGSVRVHDRDPNGNPRLRVEEPGREPRTYVYERDGSGTWVNVYDDDGNRIDRYYYDPDAQLTDAQPIPTDQPTPEAAEDEKDGDDRSDQRVWWFLGAVAVALALATWWYLRRRSDDDPEHERDWAEDLQARLEQLGQERGRRRAEAETVTEYAEALAGGVLPHEHLPAVGRVLSDALFGPTQPPEEVRDWARAVVAAAEEANPLTGRRRREPASARR